MAALYSLTDERTSIPRDERRMRCRFCGCLYEFCACRDDLDTRAGDSDDGEAITDE